MKKFYIVFISVSLLVIGSMYGVFGSKQDITWPSNKRANILDKNGNVLAESIESYDLIANPSAVNNNPDLLDEYFIEKVLELPLSTFQERIKTKKNLQYLYVKRFISETKKLEIDEVGLPEGFYFEGVYTRHYSTPSLSQLIGLTDVDQNGIEGLEKRYDISLQKQPLSLSVDINHQQKLTNALTDLTNSIKDNYASAIALTIDLNSNELQGQAILPYSNPNNRNSIKLYTLSNRILTDTYEFGDALLPINEYLLNIRNRGTVDDLRDLYESLPMNDNYSMTRFNNALNQDELASQLSRGFGFALNVKQLTELYRMALLESDYQSLTVKLGDSQPQNFALNSESLNQLGFKHLEEGDAYYQLHSVYIDRGLNIVDAIEVFIGVYSQQSKYYLTIYVISTDASITPNIAKSQGFIKQLF